MSVGRECLGGRLGLVHPSANASTRASGHPSVVEVEPAASAGTTVARPRFGVTVCGSRVVGLGVFGNGLEGELPGSLGSLANLRELLLQQNELRGPVPASLGNLACLETLDLSGNAFEGPLPEALGGCARLE